MARDQGNNMQDTEGKLLCNHFMWKDTRDFWYQLLTTWHQLRTYKLND